MPAVILPDELIKQLEEGDIGKIDDTDGPGVAVYWASDRRTRADIYLGIKLDGFNLYENINYAHPNITMQFAIEPDFLCPSDIVTFKTNRDSAIALKVKCRFYMYCFWLHMIICRSLLGEYL